MSWEQFQQIQQAIAENVRGSGASGAVQGGAALLAGLLRCRRCGRKLTVLCTGNQLEVTKMRGLVHPDQNVRRNSQGTNLWPLEPGRDLV